MTEAMNLVPWARLSPQRQNRLWADYALDPDCPDGGLTGAGATEDKVAAFAAWLSVRGVGFSVTDFHQARWQDNSGSGVSQDAMG